MKMSKMKNQQSNIIVLTVIIFLLMAVKYFFILTLLPVSFFIIELVSAMLLLLMLYYTDKTIKKMDRRETNLTDENQSLNQTIDHLKSELEKKNNTSQKEFSTGNTIENIDNLFKNLPLTIDDSEFYNNILTALADNFEIVIALFFTYKEQSHNFSVEGNYGIQKDEPVASFVIGEGLHGEALKEKKAFVLEDLPEEYFVGYSGLGESKPKHLYVLPVADEEKSFGVIEVASFKPLNLEVVWSEINKKLVELITVR